MYITVASPNGGDNETVMMIMMMMVPVKMVLESESFSISELGLVVWILRK